MAARVFCSVAIALALCSPVAAGDYRVQRAPDAPFAFTVPFGGTFNQGSSLRREAIALNDPDCPVQLTKTSSSFELVKSNFALVSKMEFETKSPVQAISIRHIVFDPFGRHLENLVSTEVLDRLIGRHSKEARWNSSGDLLPELLTTVSYVARVRLSDGTQWSYDETKLLATLGQLQLEPTLEGRQRSESNRPQ
jgi:hypothetical protein